MRQVSSERRRLSFLNYVLLGSLITSWHALSSSSYLGLSLSRMRKYLKEQFQDLSFLFFFSLNNKSFSSSFVFSSCSLAGSNIKSLAAHWLTLGFLVWDGKRMVILRIKWNTEGKVSGSLLKSIKLGHKKEEEDREEEKCGPPGDVGHWQQRRHILRVQSLIARRLLNGFLLILLSRDGRWRWRPAHTSITHLFNRKSGEIARKYWKW